MMKRFRTILSLVLVFSLIAAFMAGCSNNAGEEPGAEASTSEEATASDGAEAATSAAEVEFDYDTASRFLPNDELIMTVNGYDIYWQEYYYWLKYYLPYLDSYYGPIEWDGEMESLITGETVTMSESVKELANDTVQYYRVIESYAAELGIEITDEDMAGYEAEMLEYYGTEDALQEEMDANYLTKDIAVYMSMINGMYSKAFESLYGTDGSEVSDEVVAAYAQENGYVQAKHILFMTVDEEGNALSDEEKAAKKQQAEEVLAMLNDYTGEDKASRFQELVDEYNEDTGASNYPDGYLYTSGAMVTAFEDAVSALGDYEISGIVESEYGYHIIMRMPVNYDSSPVGDTYGYTLRYYTAYQAFSNLLQEKAAVMEVEYADAYEKIIPSEVFPVIEVVNATDSSGTDTSGTDTSAADATETE